MPHDVSPLPPIVTTKRRPELLAPVGGWSQFFAAINAGADAVLAASVFHFGTLTISQVKDAIAAHGHPVRQVQAG